MFCNLFMDGMSNSERLDKIMKISGARHRYQCVRAERMKRQRMLLSKNDRFDQKLVKIIGRNSDRYVANGHYGSLKMLSDVMDQDSYKKKAALHLLALRGMRRWHEQCNGRNIDKKACRSFLEDASLCRRRASGQESLPKVKIMAVL